MRQPVDVSGFSELAQVPASDIETFRAAGLLDLDGDGLYDDYDVLRLRVLMHYQELGHTLDEVADAVQRGSPGILYSDLLFGWAGARVSLDEAAERVGMPTGDIQAIRRAMGLPGAVLQERDIEFLTAAKALIDTGLPLDALLEVARVYGDTFRKLAQTEVRVMRFYVDEPLSQEDMSERERSERLQAFQELLEPLLDPLVQYIHRQHLLRASVEDAVARLEATEPTGAKGALDATIVFVDLASFTPLAEVHGDEVAAHVLERFDGLVRDVIVDRSGEVVKQIGDAFMLTFSDPVDAVRFAIALDEAAVTEPQFPAIRAGIHHGPVLYRVGDYVGHTVNLASRIAAMAVASEILVTKSVAAAAVEEDIQLEPAGERAIRGLSEAVQLWRVVRTGHRATRRESDPVCGMVVGPHPAARLLHGGFEFVFCSQECLGRFLEQPSRYLRPEPEDKPVL